MTRAITFGLAFCLAACSQADGDHKTDVAGNGLAGEASLDLNEGSTEAATAADEVGAGTEGADASSDQLWMGSVGGSGDQTCSRASGGDIASTPYIPVQHGLATILSESSDVVVLWTRRADNGKDMKMVYGTSRAACERARTNALNEPFPQ